MSQIPELTRPEYDILRILWKHSELSVREVHNHLSESKQWAYTTTKTTMDRMVNKSLLNKSKFHGVFIYQPMISRPAGLVKMIRFFAEQVLELDYNTVTNLFTQSDSLTKKEIQELKRLLKEDGKNNNL